MRNLVALVALALILGLQIEPLFAQPRHIETTSIKGKKQKARTSDSTDGTGSGAGRKGGFKGGITGGKKIPTVQPTPKGYD